MIYRLTFITAFLFFFTASAQFDSISFSKHHFWGSIGTGYTHPATLNLTVSATYLFRNFYSVQGNYYELFTRKREYSLNKLRSYVFLVGINKSLSPLNSFMLHLGPSFGNGKYYGADTASQNANWGAQIILLGIANEHKYEIENYQYFGLYVSAQYLIRTRYYALGIRLYCNFHRKTDFGFTLSHNVGILRKVPLMRSDR